MFDVHIDCYCDYGLDGLITDIALAQMNEIWLILDRIILERISV